MYDSLLPATVRRTNQEPALKKIVRSRVIVSVSLALCAVALAVGAGLWVRDGSPSSASTPARPRAARVTRAVPTTTTIPPTTTTTIPPLQQPAAAALPEVPGGTIGPGANGPEVQAYEQRLADLHFDPGPVDGHYDQMTAYAVQALQKMFDAPRTGRIGAPERFALGVFQYPAPLQPDGGPNRTEIDVSKQVLTLYENWQVKLISPVSTGAGELYCYDTPRENPTQHVCEHANTPSGAFKFERFVNGWDKSPLGQLYNPYYFNGGIAVHGYASVPVQPASHGCVRIPMHISEYFHTLVHQGDPVYVFGGTDANVVSRTPIGPPPAPGPTPAPAPAPPPPAPAPPPPAPAPAAQPTP